MPLIVLLALVGAACSADGTSISVDQVAEEPEETPDSEETPEPEPEDTPEPEPEDTPEPEPEDTPEPEPEDTPEPDDTPDPEGGADPSEVGGDVFSGLFSADEFGSGFDDETNTCIGVAVIERLGIAEVIALEETETLTPEAGQAAVDALFECVDDQVIGMELADAILSELGFPAPEASEACLVETYSDKAEVSTLFDIFVRVGDIDFEDVPPDDQRAVIGPILGCIGIGDILQGTLQVTGQSLSAEGVECLNAEGGELVELLIASGGADFDDIPIDQQEAVVEIFLSCLTIEDIELLGGL